MFRQAFFVAIGFALSLTAQAQGAGSFPDRPIHLIVPSGAGGPADVVSRLLADKLKDVLGQPVIVEAKGGANGNIAAEMVANAPPDGHTIMMGTIGVLAINPLMYKGVRFDPLKDFAPVIHVIAYPSLLIVRPTLPVKSVKELIEYAKANPGKLRYGSPGIGGSPHMSMELLGQMTGTDLTHVPYQGAAPALTDIIAGHIDMAFSVSVTTLPYARAGKVRALAVSGPNRLKADPDIPTVAESGAPGFDVQGWFGIAAPAATPPDRVSKLNAAFNTVLAMPDIRAKLEAEGSEIIGGTPEAFRRYMIGEKERWTKVVVDGNLGPK